MPEDAAMSTATVDAERRLRELEDTVRATLNLLEDFDEEKSKLSMLNRAMVNLLEDVNDEREELDSTQRALLNILEDVEFERARAEHARALLEAANQSLRQQSAQLKALASELTMAEQRERQRLAQTLHDGLQQTLVGAKIRLEMVAISKDPDVWGEVARIGELIAESIRTSRLLTTELSPPILYAGGLVPALEDLVRWMRDRHRLIVNLNILGPVQNPEQALAVTLYQATRELLFNVVKHAQVGTASVEATEVEDQIQITVSDDGIGFDPSSLGAKGFRRGGFGLFSIRERLGLLGGTLQVQSAPGQGCRFTMRAPVSPAGKIDADGQ